MLLLATAAAVAVESDTSGPAVCNVVNKRSNECHPMPTAPANNNDDTVTEPTVSNLPNIF